MTVLSVVLCKFVFIIAVSIACVMRTLTNKQRQNVTLVTLFSLVLVYWVKRLTHLKKNLNMIYDLLVVNICTVKAAYNVTAYKVKPHIRSKSWGTGFPLHKIFGYYVGRPDMRSYFVGPECDIISGFDCTEDHA